MDSLHFQGGNFDPEFLESSTQPQNFTQMNGLSRRYSGNSYQDLRSYEQDQSFDRQKRLSFEQDFVHSPASNGFDQQQVTFNFFEQVNYFYNQLVKVCKSNIIFAFYFSYTIFQVKVRRSLFC